jgi:surface antigen
MTVFATKGPRLAAHVLALALAGIVFGGGSASAQYGAVFGSMRPGPGDQQMIRERSQALLDGPAAARGLDWDNPRSCNSGSVTLQREFERRGQTCRQLEYRIIHQSQADPEVAIVLWCRQPSGRWALVG